MAGAAQRDLDTISNLSGDTLLLGDVSDSEIPPSESQNVLLSLSLELLSVELQTAEQQPLQRLGTQLMPPQLQIIRHVLTRAPAVIAVNSIYLALRRTISIQTSHRIVHSLPTFRLVFSLILWQFSTL